MERSRIFKIFTSSLLAIALAACGTRSASVSHDIKGCGGKTEVDLQPGSMETIKARGGQAEITLLDGKTMKLNNITMNSDPNTYYLGDSLNTDHLKLTVQGDTDGDGGINIFAESVCPAPESTKTPKPTKTPNG